MLKLIINPTAIKQIDICPYEAWYLNVSYGTIRGLHVINKPIMWFVFLYFQNQALLTIVYNSKERTYE